MFEIYQYYGTISLKCYALNSDSTYPHSTGFQYGYSLYSYYQFWLDACCIHLNVSSSMISPDLFAVAMII
ncbi:MAG: hypothetical protein HY578_06400 [Nitrospinae bacterium]|nr:hypothetical protein [Nitrospinota bacterium]